MIVVDASAILELLLRTPASPPIERRLFESNQSLHAPHLLDVEVAQVVRRYVTAGEADARRGGEALKDLSDLALTRYPHDFLLPRIWELRSNLSAYDAVYIALAEVLDAPLITRDQKLAKAPGHRARIEVV